MQTLFSHISYKQMFRFKAGSQLHDYLVKYSKIGFSRLVTDYNWWAIIMSLYMIFWSKLLYHDNNPAIIICDSELEQIVGCAAFHLSHLKEFVLKHADPLSHFVNNSTMLEFLCSYFPAKYSRSECMYLYQDVEDSFNKYFDDTGAMSNSPLLGIMCNAELERVFHVRSIPLFALKSLIEQQLVPPTNVGSWSVCNSDLPLWHLPDCYPAMVTKRAVRDFDITAKYRPTPSLLIVLHDNDEVDKTQTVFRYQSLISLVSKYIFKHNLIDSKNIRILNVENDPLGSVFNVKHIARSQITQFVRDQLTLVRDYSLRERSPTKRNAPGDDLPPEKRRKI